jgi:hypothetical protein
VKAHQAEHHIATVCRVLEVSSSGYYAWRHRGPSTEPEQVHIVISRIAEIHTQLARLA